jgi:hypothetical protein
MPNRRQSQISLTLAKLFAGGILALAPGLQPGLAAQTSNKVQLAIAKDNVHVGEPFSLRLQVSTASRIAAPDLSSWSDFSVTPTGSTSSSSRGVSITINGRQVRRNAVNQIFDYQLIARKAGNLPLPPVSIIVDGENHTTPAHVIRAQAPPEQSKFKLRLKLPAKSAYVGEPIEVSLVFYYRANARNLQPTLSPFANPDAFHTHKPEGQQGVKGPLEIVDGQQFNSHVFRTILIPKFAGSYQLDMATIVFYAITGQRNARDFFGRIVQEPVTERSIVASRPQTLTVLALPDKGRPPNFGGHIGQYQITASATPTEVNIGDPITLTVALTGPPYLDHVDLPALGKQANLAKLFKIPAERESGKVQGANKTFTQTIRALSEGVAEIPPIELPYFDTASGAYKIAKSEPIKIKVNTTRIVTASDAEGLTPVGQTSELEALAGGIAYNYEGLDALTDQRFGPHVWLNSPVSMATIVAPPLAYFALLILLSTMRRRNADPLAVASRKALPELNRRLPEAVSLDHVLEAFRGYLGGKLHLASGALTFKDVEAPLLKQGVDKATVAAVKQIFETCEVSRYAGGNAGGTPESLTQDCLELARKIEAIVK